MNIIPGILLALVLATGVLGWQLKVAWTDVEVARQEAAQARQTYEEQVRQGKALMERLDALDASLTGLAQKTLQNALQLDQTITAINNITKTETDNDQQIECLDVLVPRQLDDSLR